MEPRGTGTIAEDRFMFSINDFVLTYWAYAHSRSVLYFLCGWLHRPVHLTSGFSQGFGVGVDLFFFVSGG